MKSKKGRKEVLFCGISALLLIFKPRCELLLTHKCKLRVEIEKSLANATIPERNIPKFR
ncbi:hypothetical protein LEP1GSC058_4018 [Leptospira fainei serovar Hurstbridge str. BUT 6]|uniref:Uncharacterized protein n=1 Tax=Leptospira fainei serovar Hurstbridge str. BUT 6 TaxID=1193011 RepID=S3VCR3_9LEPT|nr:hypothetical protein LEP1GSC058_4018 [Leptospira fainei serovar Hurstbridge str. BUT 6]